MSRHPSVGLPDETLLHRSAFFVRRCTSSMRTLPRFLIIGAQKSGTTRLYEYLNQHPAVARSFTQEVHFFDLNFARGLGWYRAHFPTFVRRRYVRRRRRMELITGEASAYYLFHPLVCARVRSTLPDVRLLVVLRDPVERAWAHYRQNRKISFEHLSFDEAIDQEESRIRGERARLMYDENATSFNYREYSYLSRGIYVDQLPLWMETFPRDQIHIVSSEELLFRDPAAVVERVQDFLGLSRRRPERLRIYPAQDQGAMSAATLDRLRDYFRPHNQRLFEYLGIDFGWER